MPIFCNDQKVKPAGIKRVISTVSNTPVAVYDKLSGLKLFTGVPSIYTSERKTYNASYPESTIDYGDIAWDASNRQDSVATFEEAIVLPVEYENMSSSTYLPADLPNYNLMGFSGKRAESSADPEYRIKIPYHTKCTIELLVYSSDLSSTPKFYLSTLPDHSSPSEIDYVDCSGWQSGVYQGQSTYWVRKDNNSPYLIGVRDNITSSISNFKILTFELTNTSSSHNYYIFPDDNNYRINFLCCKIKNVQYA